MYTDEDYQDLLIYMGVTYNVRTTFTCGDEKIKYWIQLTLQSYGQHMVNDALKILFKEPLENMPLYINHVLYDYAGNPKQLNKLAAWRLHRGK
jgi:hypothetical protein